MTFQIPTTLSSTLVEEKTTKSSPATTTFNYTSTTGTIKPNEGVSDVTVAGLIVGVVAVIGALLLVLFYFTKYRHNRFDLCRAIKRRTWSTGSNYSQHNPLEPDDTGTSEPPPVRTSRQLFSITDNDDDGFIYDEIFDASEFTDEKTKKSLRHLYTAAPSRDDVPDLNLRI